MHARLRRLPPPLLLLVLPAFFWCFGSVLLGNRSFGFRDAANYYYPLLEWECQEWRAGRIPLWNPLDNLGAPLLADTTSGVLYPGKLLFLLPGSFRWRYHLFVALHVLLAAATIYWLARHWQASREASMLAALSYAFGGSVLFQYCNVVFLIGAAWLPLALYFSDRMLAERAALWAVMLGGVLALMTLGGDPQAAYHAGLLALLQTCLFSRGPARQTNTSAAQLGCWNPAFLLAIAAATGFCLAAVQILPASELTQASDRAAFDDPRNLYEVVAGFNELLEQRREGHRDEIGSRIVRGLFARPEPDTHLEHVYDYSLGPWHLTGLAWPNLFGKPFPTNQRWITALPGEGRLWTPSLYFGLLPLVLAVGSWRLRQADRRVRLPSWMVLLGLLGSFGWYGLAWLMHELQAGLSGAEATSVWIGEPVGGLYWLMVVLLPGYVYFRYPAKLLVIAALGMSLLAARRWDEMAARGTTSVRCCCLKLTLLSLAAALLFAVSQPWWRVWLAGAPVDATFGPLDVRGATAGVLASLGQTAAVALLLWWLLGGRRTSVVAWPRQTVLLVTAVDLGLANGWMIATVPAGVWEAPRALVSSMAHTPGKHQAPPRLWRDANAKLQPKVWSAHGSRWRLEEVVAWERQTLLPRHQLSADVACWPAHTTLRGRYEQALARLLGGRDLAWQERLGLARVLALGYVLLPETAQASGLEPLTEAEGVRLWQVTDLGPRAWIVHRAERLTMPRNRSRTAVEALLRQTFLDGDSPRDLRAVVVLEEDHGEFTGSVDETDHDETSLITHYDPQLIELRARLNREGWLVLSEAYDPGWRAERTNDGVHHPLTVLRANGVLRAVRLPPGEHAVRFVYRPRSFWAGAALSGASWLAACIAVIWWYRRRTRSIREGPPGSSSPGPGSA